MQCTICRGEVQSDQKIFTCSFCDTSFHAGEIIEWFQENDDCPHCRSDTDPYEIFLLTDEFDMMSGADLELDNIELRETEFWQRRKERKREIRKNTLSLFVFAVIILYLVIFLTDSFLY